MTRIVPAFGANAMKVLCKRYLRPVTSQLAADARGPDGICSYCGKSHETPEEMLDRCSFGNDDYYNLLASLDFLPNSPTLFNAGTGQGTFSACFKLDVEDSLESIQRVDTKAAFVQKWGGGVGYALSEIRPKGRPIKTTHGKACGPIAVLRKYQATAQMITQGGKREGAQMAILHCDHDDVREFIHCKDLPPECACAQCSIRASCEYDRTKALNTFNLSVACTDEFMAKVERGTCATNKKDAAAYQLFNEIVDSAWRRGDPGLFFIDTAERANPTPWLGKITGTNPCGEVPMLNNEACLAGDTLVLVNDSIRRIGDSLAFPTPAKRFFTTSYSNHETVGLAERILRGTKFVVKVTFRTGVSIKVTRDHRFIGIEGSEVEAGLLLPGDRVRRIRTNPMVTSIVNESWSPRSLDADAFLFGWIHGDGWYTANSVGISFNGKDGDFGARDVLLPEYHRLFGRRKPLRDNNDSYQEQTSNKDSLCLCASLGFTPARACDRSLPGWFYRASLREQLFFLRGLFSADASVRGKARSQVAFYSNSCTMIEGVQQALSALGIWSRRNISRFSSSDREDQIQLVISKASAVRFMNTIGFFQDSKSVKFNLLTKHYHDDDYEEVRSVEPCGMEEVYDLAVAGTHVFFANGVLVHNCNLGSINLTHMIDDGSFNFRKLVKTARLATRYLDTVLDNNQFPDPDITAAAELTRKLGLGVMGWADGLAMLGIHYDSDEAVKLAGEVMSIIQNASHEESQSLAEKKGVCDCFNVVEENSDREPGSRRRNATTTCIAPSGTISVLAGVSAGIEPHFSLDGVRAMGDGTRLNASVNTEVRNFKPHTTHEIHWSWHIKHQAAFQKYTDLAVSKTINMPESATHEDILSAYVAAWKSGCKGITVYRNNSRAQQIVVDRGQESHLHTGHVSTSVPPASVAAAAPPTNGRRKVPNDSVSIRHKFRVGGLEAYLHIGLYPDGTPGEMFITGNKQGSTVNGLLDAVAILTSLSLQYGVPLRSLADKMKGTRFEPAGLTESKEIPIATSVIDYMFRFLEKKFLSPDGGPAAPASTGMLCPDCGAMAIFEEGCLRCAAGCGWSRCG